MLKLSWVVEFVLASLTAPFTPASKLNMGSTPCYGPAGVAAVHDAGRGEQPLGRRLPALAALHQRQCHLTRILAPRVHQARPAAPGAPAAARRRRVRLRC